MSAAGRWWSHLRGRRYGDWIQSFTGRQLWVEDPRPEDVCIVDAAHHLSLCCRYAGAVRQHYSVAEHSVIVSLYVPPEFAREGLLHDLPEYALGDVTRPLKRAHGMRGYRKLERLWTDVVAERFALRWTPGATRAVKDIDDRILFDERPALLCDGEEWRWHREPLGATIAALPPPQAEQVFLARFAELFPEEVARARSILVEHGGVDERSDVR